MYSLMNSTQISSLLCRWRLAVSKMEKQNKHLMGQETFDDEILVSEKQLNAERHSE